MVYQDKMHVAVVGSGAAGLSAAWLLSKAHRVTLIEKDNRLGGHAHTATIGPDVGVVKDVNANVDIETQISPHSLANAQPLKIDTGFIVYNEPSYPNMTRWFESMAIATEASDMSFSVSRDDGGFEYAGGPVFGLLAQPSLPLKPRFWRMLSDLLRFYREAPGAISDDCELTLGEFLELHRYNKAFIEDHLLPFGAAIWSTPKALMLDYPASAFIRFCANHGLLQLSNRPQWRTVSGGSERYVKAVENTLNEQGHDIVTGFDAARVRRFEDHVVIVERNGTEIRADHVVFACHADQALASLETPSEEERHHLSAFAYEPNLAVLHTDESFLPKRRRAWCSWNYVEKSGDDSSNVSLSYWMNRLQNISGATNYIVTLNPAIPPSQEVTYRTEQYHHPVFTKQTLQAQQSLWSVQGQHRTWFCGSYFGSGFHEDAVQSGLAVAEQLGQIARPWRLEDPSPRIVVPSRRLFELPLPAAESA